MLNKNPLDLLNKLKQEDNEQNKQYFGRLKGNLAATGMKANSPLFDATMLLYFEQGLRAEIRNKLINCFAFTITAAFENAKDRTHFKS